MAYLDTNSPFTTARSAGRYPEPEGVGFSPLEWTVVMLAKGDTLSSLGTPSRLSRALGTVLGVGTKSNLADPRLEALRRVAVHAWHRGAEVPASEANEFLAAGFDRTQLHILLGSIAAGQGARA